ncbi:MAG: hypothetical protein K2V38_14725 [Gemmataceae bacterium]|nr:hypothetical protein [Gemmataceae bacterium]
MTLTLVLIGVSVFVVFGAVAALRLDDTLARRRRRKANEVARRQNAEDEVW